MFKVQKKKLTAISNCLLKLSNRQLWKKNTTEDYLPFLLKNCSRINKMRWDSKIQNKIKN